MRSKLLILLAALILGAAAAVIAVVYVGGARQQVEQLSQPVEVLVARQDILRGTPVEQLIAGGLVERQLIPKAYVAAGAISATRTLEGQVLAATVTKGEQLTASRFQFPSSAGLAYSVPSGFIAVAVPFTDTRGVGGLIKPGDTVVVFGTAPGANGDMMTKVLIPKAKVLAFGRNVGVEPQQQTNNSIVGGQDQSANSAAQKTSSVTLALPAGDAERVIFAEENAKVWLGLLPAEQSEIPATPGRTQRTLFGR